MGKSSHFVFPSEEKAPGKKGSSIKDILRKTPIAGMEVYSAICSFEKAFKAVKDFYRRPVQAAVIDDFVRRGCRDGERPDNFDAEEGKGVASCQLKVMGSDKDLSEDALTACKLFGIPTHKITDKEKTFILNPEYAKNKEMIAKMDKALKGKGFPSDLFLPQMEQSRLIVVETGLERVFSLTPDKAKKILPVAGSIAISAKYQGEPEEAFQVVNKILKKAWK